MEKLKPCPFCKATSNDADNESCAGAVALNDPKYNKSGRSFIQCGNCGVIMHEYLYSTRENLIKRWNTRADEQSALLDQMAEALRLLLINSSVSMHQVEIITPALQAYQQFKGEK